VANAGVRGRPIAPLVLSCAGASVLGEASSSSSCCPGRYPNGAARSCDVRMAYQASSVGCRNSAFMNTPLASGAADF